MPARRRGRRSARARHGRRTRPRTLVFGSSLIIPIPPGGSIVPTPGAVNPTASSARSGRGSAPQAKSSGTDPEGHGRVGGRLAVEVRPQGGGTGDSRAADRADGDPGVREVGAAIDRGKPAQELDAPEGADDDEG